MQPFARSRQSGVTLIELLTVVAVASAMFITTVSYSLPWMARQTMHSAIHDAQAFLQLAKIEAVSRNRPCRFVVDKASGALEVWDGRGTDAFSDDELLHQGLVHETVSFGRPDTGGDVTLEQIGTTSAYQTTFRSDGTVAGGSGEICLSAGGGYGRLSVYAAGGLELSYWKQTRWSVGS